ncbi:unnamed protein product [Rotaria socialis]|uniref:AIG1-type G domain-containing protein n=1 Tax=Rotaria socialis TaxID=392032 RepID=A0A817X1P0_9BILA|nr:unnamed protein product [Rotaria socialis]CAF4823508.1 unnamed protein product [Rotaria socialis]
MADYDDDVEDMAEEAKKQQRCKQISRQIKDLYQQCKFKDIREVILRNVLIIGRTRTGKSTIKDLLIDPTKVQSELTMVSETKGPVFTSFVFPNASLLLNIIDTPGVFERGNQQEMIRSDEAIMKAIVQCVNLELTKFHLVCFAFSMTAGIQRDDMDALKLFMDRLGPEVSLNACLIKVLFTNQIKTDCHMEMTETMTITSQQERLMQEIQQIFYSKEQKKATFNDKEPKERNILLVGRQKSGKTTFAKMLENPRKVCDELAIFSQNESIEIERIKTTNPTLLIKVVDTIGLNDYQNPNEQLQWIREQCIDHRIRDFHLICFVISITDGFHHQDIDYINYMTKNFGENIEHNLCMIITRCESKTESQRKRCYEQLANDTKFRHVIHLFKQGIHFSGALNYDDWNLGNHSLRDQFLNVHHYREKLLDLMDYDIRAYTLTVQNVTPMHLSVSPSSDPQTDNIDEYIVLIADKNEYVVVTILSH